MVIVDLVSLGKRMEDSTAQLAARVPSEHQRAIAAAGNSAVRFVIKIGRRILFIDASEIIALEARRNNIVLHLKGGSRIFRQSISNVSETLLPFGFVRVHRSFIVNSAVAQEIEALPTGEYLLRVQGGKEYTVTRRYRKNLRFLAASWLGSPISEQLNSLTGIGIPC